MKKYIAFALTTTWLISPSFASREAEAPVISADAAPIQKSGNTEIVNLSKDPSISTKSVSFAGEGLDDNTIGKIIPLLKDGLENLNLEGNNIGLEGIKALLPRIPLSIRKLNLYLNNINDSCIEELAKYVPLFVNLVELNLGFNKLSDSSFEMLIPLLPPNLTILGLTNFPPISQNSKRNLNAHGFQEETLPFITILGKGVLIEFVTGVWKRKITSYSRERVSALADQIISTKLYSEQKAELDELKIFFKGLNTNQLT